MEDYLFNSAAGLKFNIYQVIQEITEFINLDKERTYKLIIGTDSDLNVNKKTADFVTAIVIQRVGNGGRYFWRHVKFFPVYNLHNRILQEVLFSLEVAKNTLLVLKNSNGPEFQLEIHIDVGENGETKSMAQELIGIIRANNFEPKIKPDSYAASKVADRHL